MTHLQRQTVSRLFLSLMIVVIALMGFYSTHSLYYALLNANDWAQGSNVALLVLSLTAFAETVLVDVLHCWSCLLCRLRQRVWLALAVLLIGYAFVMTKSDSSGLATVFLLLFGLFSAAIATMDAHVEIRQRRLSCIVRSLRSNSSR